MNLSRKIETTANVATIIVAVLLSTVLIKLYVLPSRAESKAPVVSAHKVVRGKNLDGRLLGVDWTKNHSTLVLAISTTCHYCNESVPFFRTLGPAGKGVKMLAVLPQTVTEARQYLSNAGVRVDDVRQVPLNTLGVRETPTLLLVNDAGVVTDVWAGKLEPSQETQVLATLEKVASGR